MSVTENIEPPRPKIGWSRLETWMKAMVLVSISLPAGGTIWAYTGGPIGAGIREEREWREAVNNSLKLVAEQGITLGRIERTLVESEEDVASIRVGQQTIFEEFDALRADNRRLEQGLRSVRGDDRVLSVTTAFIEEPVYGDTDITFVLIAERTELGKDCNFVQSQIFFRDETGILFIGEVQPARVQLSNDEPRQLRTVWQKPEGMLPGIISAYRILEYSCAGVSVFEPVYADPFRLLDETAPINLGEVPAPPPPDLQTTPALDFPEGEQ